MGGHSVPKEKILSRYYRSLKLLPEAVKYSNRAYLFDNSSQEKSWLAEVTEGKEFEYKSQFVPAWINGYLFGRDSSKKK